MTTSRRIVQDERSTIMPITKRAIAIGVASAATVASGPGVAPTVDGALAAARVHHMRYVALPTAGHRTGHGTFVGTEVNRHQGKVVGYDTLSGNFGLQTNNPFIRVAISRRGGLLFWQANLGGSEHFTGKVTGGRGRFGGARGTVRGFSPEGANKMFVRIRWHAWPVAYPRRVRRTAASRHPLASPCTKRSGHQSTRVNS
jgi:hypothetical protein